MSTIFFLMKLVYIFFTGLLLPLFFDVPFYVYMALFLFNALLLPIYLERVVEERVRVRNYARCALAFYMPILVYSIFLLFFMFFHFEIYIVILVFLLLTLFFIVVFRKQAMVPYLMLVSSMPYKRMKEESKHLYKQRKLENSTIVVVYMAVLFILTIIQYNLAYVDGKIFNCMSVLPLAIIELYASLCVSVVVHGNEVNKGRFSLKAVGFLLVLSVLLPLTMLGSNMVLDVKSDQLLQEQIQGKTYTLSSLRFDFENYHIGVKSVKEVKSDVEFLTNVELKVLPVEYEVYYVEDIRDDSKEERDLAGITLLQKEKAKSFVTNADDNESIELVFYHEYAHILFNYMENKEKLIQEYEKLRIQEYDEDTWSTYYVSKYATSDTIVDMCEQYAFYMSNAQYRTYMPTNKHHKAKSDLIRQCLIEEYNYDFYEE